MENEKELREIQDISELVNVPVGEIVVYKDKKIEVRKWSSKTGCWDCCFSTDTDKIGLCDETGCTPINRPDKKEVLYVKID